MAMWLFHPTHKGDPEKGHANGRLFAPDPTVDQLEALKKRGWVEKPWQLPGYVAPETKVLEFMGDLTELEVLDAEGRGGLDAGGVALPVDIRKVKQAQAVEIIGSCNDKAWLMRSMDREAANPIPKGGRKVVLQALAERIEQL